MTTATRANNGPSSNIAMGRMNPGADLWSVFSEDLAAPPDRPSIPRTAEMGLMSAVLQEAVRDAAKLAKGMPTATLKKGESLEAHVARELGRLLDFIHNGSLDWPFSLPSLCDHLGLSLGVMQSRLLAVLAGRVVPMLAHKTHSGSLTRVQDTSGVTGYNVHYNRTKRNRVKA